MPRQGRRTAEPKAEPQKAAAGRGQRRGSSGQRGSAAVEFAIIAPILFALLCGIVTAGLGYNNVLGLADGVREGARYGATLTADSSWGGAVQQKTVDLTSLNTGSTPVVTTSMVCTQLVKVGTGTLQSSSCSLAASAPGTPSGLAAGTCIVKVWGTIPVRLTFILIPSVTVNVNRQSVTLYERTC